MTTRYLILSLLCISTSIYAQQFNTLHIERTEIDTNNTIYQSGKVYTYDYEIIDQQKAYRLNNNGSVAEGNFELVEATDDTFNLKIQLIVPKLDKSQRTNKRQTEILYLFIPIYTAMERTGIVENDENVWIHPPRSGFFRSLETCPFPYVKLPLEVGKEWQDKMKISNHWSHEKWGVWDKKLLLHYNYKIARKTMLETALGDEECYVVESTAKSEIGESKLLSYYSEKYGFVRLEYTMATGLQVNLWLCDYLENQKLDGLEDVVSFLDECQKM
ncbi:MAG: hypothetical protein N4A74_00170 [Carboxylicivirga sp.]|nr:hypothetical protein [Carboxylicivirga sp.]